MPASDSGSESVIVGERTVNQITIQVTFFLFLYFLVFVFFWFFEVYAVLKSIVYTSARVLASRSQ